MPRQSLKVLHVASGDLWAGAENHLWQVALELKNRVEVELTVVLFNHGELDDRLCAEGIDCVVIDEKLSSFWSITKKLRALVKSTAPDIIHTHGSKEAITSSLASCFVGYHSMFQTTHGSPEFYPSKFEIRGKLITSLGKWSGSRKNVTHVAVAPHLTAQLHESFPKNNVITINNGINVDNLRNRQESLQLSGRMNVAFFGRLVHTKRVDIILQIASMSSPDVHFHIFGDGPLRSDLEDQARELNVVDRVIFYGHMNNAADLIANFDCVLLVSDHEGRPTIALECFALGIPMLAHAVGGLANIFRRYPDCLVENQKPESYALRLHSGLEEAFQKFKPEQKEIREIHICHMVDTLLTRYKESHRSRRARGLITK